MECRSRRSSFDWHWFYVKWQQISHVLALLTMHLMDRWKSLSQNVWYHWHDKYWIKKSQPLRNRQYMDDIRDIVICLCLKEEKKPNKNTQINFTKHLTLWSIYEILFSIFRWNKNTLTELMIFHSIYANFCFT